MNLTYPVEMNSVVEQRITTYGFGLMGAFGIGPMWMSLDANFTWNKPDLLEKADEVLTPIVNKIDEADGSSIIRYGMDKQVKQMWNGIIGMQFQLNKHWMLRTEGGIIGDRKSFLLSANYRFLM